MRQKLGLIRVRVLDADGDARRQEARQVAERPRRDRAASPGRAPPRTSGRRAQRVAERLPGGRPYALRGAVWIGGADRRSRRASPGSLARAALRLRAVGTLRPASCTEAECYRAPNPGASSSAPAAAARRCSPACSPRAPEVVQLDLRVLNGPRRRAPLPAASPSRRPAFAALIAAEQPVPHRGAAARLPGRGGRLPVRRAAATGAATRCPGSWSRMLPRLSDDPDALFDALSRVRESAPARARRAQHYGGSSPGSPRARARRAGSSARAPPSSICRRSPRASPSARFLHLHRDGRGDRALDARAPRLPRSRSRSSTTRRSIRGRRRPASSGPIDFAAPPRRRRPISRSSPRARPPRSSGATGATSSCAASRRARDRLRALRRARVSRICRAAAGRARARSRASSQLPGAAAWAGWLARAAALVRGAPPAPRARAWRRDGGRRARRGVPAGHAAARTRLRAWSG